MSYRTVGVSVLLVGAVAASAGDLLPYHRKAKLRCGLSNCYDYEVRRTSPPAVGTTFNTLTLPLVPATAPVNENPALAPLGKPELFHLDVTPFWVDRDQILLHRASGSLKTTPPELRLLPLVDRMTVEFRYE